MTVATSGWPSIVGLFYIFHITFFSSVGDSRAVFGNDSGLAVPMSYDHKPCQLKEKKRIQEAGGFVAMNGVWRVMGVLATSRALGDFPLKVNIS